MRVISIPWRIWYSDKLLYSITKIIEVNFLLCTVDNVTHSSAKMIAVCRHQGNERSKNELWKICWLWGIDIPHLTPFLTFRFTQHFRHSNPGRCRTLQIRSQHMPSMAEYHSKKHTVQRLISKNFVILLNPRYSSIFI